MAQTPGGSQTDSTTIRDFEMCPTALIRKVLGLRYNSDPLAKVKV
jgi:hypothetical protein